MPSLLAGRAWLILLAAALAFLSWLLSALIAAPLVEIEVSNQRVEAALRKKLVIDEDAPRAGGIAAGHSVLLTSLRRNYRALYCNLLWVDEWLDVSTQAMLILPMALGASQMFAEAEARASLGELVQLNSVFQTVFKAFSLPASSWAEVQDFRSVVRRLQQFERSTRAGVATGAGSEAVGSHEGNQRLML